MDIARVIKLRDDFHKKRDGLKEKIAQHEAQIAEHQTSISQLQESIDNSRPFINGCDVRIKCENYDIYSMKYMGDTPNPDKNFIYKCVICNNEQKYT